MTEDETPRFDRRFFVSVDWKEAPVGTSSGALIVKGKRGAVKIKVSANRATIEQTQAAKGRFASLGSPLAIAADQATHNLAVDGVGWQAIPDYGRGAAAMTVFPVTARNVRPGRLKPGASTEVRGSVRTR